MPCLLRLLSLALWQQVEIPAGVLFGPDAGGALLKGINQMANLLSATLEPPGCDVPSRPLPKLLDILKDETAIARPAIELPTQYVHTRATVVRRLAWRVRQEAAIAGEQWPLLQAILEESCRCIVARVNPMLIHRGPQEATRVAADPLKEMAQRIQGRAEVIELAEVLAMVFFQPQGLIQG